MIRVLWSRINQAYLILWNDSVLAIKNTREEVDAYLADRGLEQHVEFDARQD